MWVALIGVIALLMQNWLNKRYNPNSNPVLTGSGNGNQELVLQRNSYGHYVASGSINGHTAVFMLDTGATDVVVPAGVADDLKLERGYPIAVRTANGTVTVYTTNLRQVTLGPIELYDVRASINPHMQDDEVLLGMSFLKHLRLTQIDDQLILGQP
jgi:aspartyl protease family protein